MITWGKVSPSRAGDFFGKAAPPLQQQAQRRRLSVDIRIKEIQGHGFDIDDDEFNDEVAEALRWGMARIREHIEEHGPENRSGFNWEDYPYSYNPEESIKESIDPEVDIEVNSFGITATMGIGSDHAAEVEYGSLALGEERGDMRRIYPRTAEALVIPLALIRNHLKPFDGEIDLDRIVTFGSQDYIYSMWADLPGQHPQHYLRDAVNRYRAAIRERVRAAARRALRMRNARFDVTIGVQVS